MADLEVHIDLDGRTRRVGLAKSNRVRGNETVVFEYVPEWLADPDRFAIEPALTLTRGGFAPLPAEPSSAPSVIPQTLPQARAIIKDVATVTATWRDTAKAVGARTAEINRMVRAFEHDDLERALAL